MPSPPSGAMTLQTIAMPADTNGSGDVFGGWLMAQMDIGASVTVRRLGPLPGGHRGGRRHGLPQAGRARGSRLDPGRGHRRGQHLPHDRRGGLVERQIEGLHYKVTEATFVFVAVDEAGRKRPLPEPTA